MNRLLSVADAALLLGVHRTRINQLIDSGDLPAERIGRAYVIKETDLELVRERASPGRPSKEEAKDKSAKSSKRSSKPAKKSRKSKAGTNHAGKIEEEGTSSEEIAAKKALASKSDPEVGKSAKRKGARAK